ncbi:hypothetical protein BJY00DRAFT_284590 [Aspergillus carlsbadensis]|nr:hypothetical protein BJY00DRAFT_284590 [Aspergillus carlsbadensis]
MLIISTWVGFAHRPGRSPRYAYPFLETDRRQCATMTDLTRYLSILLAHIAYSALQVWLWRFQTLRLFLSATPES